jgi:hypothetical protein
MTRRELQARFPNISEDVLRRTADDYNRDFSATGDRGLRATDTKRTELVPLGNKAPRKAKGRSRVVQRYQVTYRIFAVRPADWDNNSIKGLQDLLVTAGLLPGDAWYQLEGSIISEKVHSKEEEKTVVEITPCQ